MTAPPILTYDVLPVGSGITLRRDHDALMIDIPPERWKFRFRRTLHSVQFWICLILALAMQIWPAIYAYYLGRAQIKFWQSYGFLAFEVGIATVGVWFAILIAARRRETIELDHHKLAHTRGGSFPHKRSEYETALIRAVEVRRNALVVMLENPPHAWRRARKAILLPCRAAAEHRYVAREMRRFLNLEVEDVA